MSDETKSIDISFLLLRYRELERRNKKEIYILFDNPVLLKILSVWDKVEIVQVSKFFVSDYKTLKSNLNNLWLFMWTLFEIDTSFISKLIGHTEISLMNHVDMLKKLRFVYPDNSLNRNVEAYLLSRVQQGIYNPAVLKAQFLKGKNKNGENRLE